MKVFKTHSQHTVQVIIHRLVYIVFSKATSDKKMTKRQLSETARMKFTSYEAWQWKILTCNQRHIKCKLLLMFYTVYFLITIPTSILETIRGLN